MLTVKVYDLPIRDPQTLVVPERHRILGVSPRPRDGFVKLRVLVEEDQNVPSASTSLTIRMISEETEIVDEYFPWDSSLMSRLCYIGPVSQGSAGTRHVFVESSWA